MRVRGRRDAGVVTVWALALVSSLGLVATVMAGVGALGAARQRAGAVADLAALAAAQSDAGCAAAEATSSANDARVVACTADGVDVVVTVEVSAPPLAARMAALLGHEPPTVRATSRAGPPPGG